MSTHNNMKSEGILAIIIPTKSDGNADNGRENEHEIISSVVEIGKDIAQCVAVECI